MPPRHHHPPGHHGPHGHHHGTRGPPGHHRPHGPGFGPAFVAGAAVGAAFRPPPPMPYHHGRGRYRQVVVVEQAPPGMPPLPPSEMLVMVACPTGCSPGSAVEIEVNGHAYNITIPPGVSPGQPFHVRVPRNPTPAVKVNPPAAVNATVPARPVAPAVAATPALAPAPAPHFFAEANPFADNNTASDPHAWVIAPFKAEFDAAFQAAGPAARPGGLPPALSPAQVKALLMPTGLPKESLRAVWELSDLDKDGVLDADEFAVAMYLCRQAQNGEAVPKVLPDNAVPPSKRNPF